MRYSRLQWHHSSPTEPVEVYSEYDNDGWERRKVEVFPDGSLGYASESESGGGSQLALIHCPPDEEVEKEPEFHIVPLTSEEFERAWNRAHQGQVRRGPRAEAG